MIYLSLNNAGGHTSVLRMESDNLKREGGRGRGDGEMNPLKRYTRLARRREFIFQSGPGAYIYKYTAESSIRRPLSQRYLA